MQKFGHSACLSGLSGASSNDLLTGLFNEVCLVL